MSALKIRAAVDNCRDNVLSDKDLETLKEIISFARSTENTFLLDEISRHPEIDEIVIAENASEIFGPQETV
jgi:hypothetical protein